MTDVLACPLKTSAAVSIETNIKNGYHIPTPIHDNDVSTLLQGFYV